MPKTKKKVDTSSDSDSGPEDRNPPAAKKSKDSGSANSSAKGGGEPASQWTLEKLRQVRINEFRGRKMVDIREHYEKNGEILPGKKGISLSESQWKKLLEYADEITKALNS